jgi:hypothetical protein
LAAGLCKVRTVVMSSSVGKRTQYFQVTWTAMVRG